MLQTLQPSEPKPLPENLQALVNQRRKEETGDEEELDEEEKPLARPPVSSESAFKHKTHFLDAMQAYSDLVFSLQAALDEQIDALQEAGIVTTKGAEPELTVTDGKKADGKDGAGSVSAGQLGGLDVGWLNERGRDTGKVFEAEIMEETRELLERHYGESGTKDTDMSGI